MRLIDADALKAYIDAQEGRPFIGCTIGEALKIMVDEQSTVEERKKGHWLIDSDGYYPYCSECRTEPSSGHMTDFCPNCGADMRKERKG